MTAAASVVAYYGEKHTELKDLISDAQEHVGRALAGHFCPRDPYEVHATIIGLENPKPGARMGDLLQYLRDEFDQAMTIQFGGFAARGSDSLRSRGLPLYQRSFTISGGDVMLMGWPVQDGDATTALDAVRRQCDGLGFTHKWYSDAYPVDPDCYLSLGRLVATVGEEAVEACEQHLREFLSGDGIQVPLAREDVSIVLYEDRSLARASSTLYRL